MCLHSGYKYMQRVYDISCRIRIFWCNVVYGVGAQVLGAKSENKMDGHKRKRRRVVDQDVEISLKGREQQMNALRTFLSSHLKNRRSGSLFITGPPGSGKSATVEAVLSEKVRNVYNCDVHTINLVLAIYFLQQWLHLYDKAVINCMNIKPQQLYRHIAQKLALSYQDGEQRCQQAVKEFVEGHQDKM